MTNMLILSILLVTSSVIFGNATIKKLMKWGDRKQVDEPVSYFQNEDYPSPTTPKSGIKVFTVSVTDPNVCQVRVDFLHFDIAVPSQFGNCLGQYIVIDDSVTFCGNNNDQNYVIHIERPTSIDIILNLDTYYSTYSYKFNLMVTQVDCYSNNHNMKDIRAPNGCDQFFTESSGIIKSFNYDGINMYPENQDYTICIKKSENSCGIKYSNCNDFARCPTGRRSIGLSGIPIGQPVPIKRCGWELGSSIGSSDAICGEECLRGQLDVGVYVGDWITVAAAQVLDWNDLANSTSYKAYYCGIGLGIDPWGTTGDGMVTGSGIIDYSDGPFILHFHTDSNNMATAFVSNNIQINNLGFVIDYHVQTGHC